MPQYIDQYFLVDNRSPASVKRFLQFYLPNHVEAAEDYLIPACSSDPEMLVNNADDVLLRLENNDADHGIYWRNLDPRSRIKHFMVFHTNDGKMIFGVSIEGNDPENSKSVSLFTELKSFLNADIGCITVEEPPPVNAVEFTEFSKNRYVPG
jgi:hypothetical protein